MHIENIRMGFATNSSSCHSIVFGLSKTDDNYDGNSEFGWDEFVLTTKESKSAYLATVLKFAIEDKIGPAMTKAVIKDWCQTSIKRDAYIDHQSLMHLPVDRMRLGEYRKDGSYQISHDFFQELFDYYMQDGLAIVGGNDNGDESSFSHFKSQRHIIPVDNHSSGELICRKDGDWWVLMNRCSGVKIRLSLKKDPNPKQYKASSTPELIDIKITDFCPFGCEYCLTPDAEILTPQGKKPISEICIGDQVYGYDHNNNRRMELTVEQLFERDYSGDMIVIETEDGKNLKLTPEHEVFTSNRGYVFAGNLTENDEILSF